VDAQRISRTDFAHPDDSRSEATSPLTLCREPRALLPEVPAEWDQIEPGLRRLVMDLVRGKGRWPLFLHGPTGTGKTSAALWLLRRIWGPRFIGKPGDLIDAVVGRQQWLWEHIHDAWLVAIDEIGSRSDAPSLELQAVQRCADERGRRPTIWISNLAPKQLLEVYDDRIVSRICSGSVYRLDGRDRRFDGREDR